MVMPVRQLTVPTLKHIGGSIIPWVCFNDSCADYLRLIYVSGYIKQQ